MSTPKFFTDAQRVTLRLPATHVSALDAWCERRGVSRNVAICRLIEACHFDGQPLIASEDRL